MNTLLRTACHPWHTAHGGRMVDFAGWEMPVQYSSIVAEHKAVRQAAGLFDIAHMGRLKFNGPDAVKFLDHLLTNEVASLKMGQVRYALVCQENGGVLDDVLVYRFPETHLLVVNASNRLKILDWIAKHQSGFDCQVQDCTESHFMLALQGPSSLSLLQPLTDIPLEPMGYYFGAPAKVLGQPALVSRTGYTGEDGYEVIVEADQGLKLWETLLAAGANAGVLPAGLGCRDTLRLEAAMPLYGHELNESVDPLTAGLGFAVKLKKPDFIGRAALEAIKATPNRPVRVGLELTGKRIAREGSLVFTGDQQIGNVTSGTFSPTLEKSISMAYVNPAQSSVGTTVDVDIRGQRIAATVVKLPFYQREVK